LTVITLSVYRILLNIQKKNYFKAFKKTGIPGGVRVSACP
jgi:hypothetical protein